MAHYNARPSSAQGSGFPHALLVDSRVSAESTPLVHMSFSLSLLFRGLVVAVISGSGDDLVHNHHPPKDLAEDGLARDSCYGGCVEDILHGLSGH